MFIIKIVLLVILDILVSFSIRKILIIYEYANINSAWIPLYNLYLLSVLACRDKLSIKIGWYNIYSLIIKFWFIPAFLLYLIPIIGWFFSLSFVMFTFGTVLQLVYARIEDVAESETKLMGYVSALCPLVLIYKSLIYSDRIRLKSIE